MLGLPASGERRGTPRWSCRHGLDRDFEHALLAEVMDRLRSCSRKALKGWRSARVGYSSANPSAAVREEDLDLQRLLAPQGSVIVERGDALGRRHVVRPAFVGHARDEIEDRAPAGPSFQDGSKSAVMASSARPPRRRSQPPVGRPIAARRQSRRGWHRGRHERRNRPFWHRAPLPKVGRRAARRVQQRGAPRDLWRDLVTRPVRPLSGRALIGRWIHP